MSSCYPQDWHWTPKEEPSAPNPQLWLTEWHRGGSGFMLVKLLDIHILEFAGNLLSEGPGKAILRGLSYGKHSAIDLPRKGYGGSSCPGGSSWGAECCCLHCRTPGIQQDSLCNACIFRDLSWQSLILCCWQRKNIWRAPHSFHRAVNGGLICGWEAIPW